MLWAFPNGNIDVLITLTTNQSNIVRQYNKQYDPPIAFDVEQPVSGVRKSTVYARNEQEAIDKVKENNLTEHDSQWFEELESDTCYVIDADESAVLEDSSS